RDDLRLARRRPICLRRDPRGGLQRDDGRHDWWCGHLRRDQPRRRHQLSVPRSADPLHVIAEPLVLEPRLRPAAIRRLASFGRFATSSRLNLIGVVLVGIVLLAAVVGRFLTPYPPEAIALLQLFRLPSLCHLF